MIFYIIIAILFGFLLGYCMGKRQGRETGYREAQAMVPLQLRQRSLETGNCALCETNWTKAAKCEIFSKDLNTL